MTPPNDPIAWFQELHAAAATSEPFEPDRAALATAANAIAGSITHPAVAETFGMDYVAPEEAARRLG